MIKRFTDEKAKEMATDDLNRALQMVSETLIKTVREVSAGNHRIITTLLVNTVINTLHVENISCTDFAKIINESLLQAEKMQMNPVQLDAEFTKVVNLEQMREDSH